MSFVQTSLGRLSLGLICRNRYSRLFLVTRDNLPLPHPCGRQIWRSFSGTSSAASARYFRSHNGPSFVVLSTVKNLSRRRQSILSSWNLYLSNSSRRLSSDKVGSVGSTKIGLADQILQSKLQSDADKSKSDDRTDEEKDKEQKEQKRAQENSIRAVKFTLLSFGAMFLGGGIYLFLVWGAPMTDRTGNEVKDEFSDLPFVEQYAKRCLSEIKNYATFLAEPSREKLLPDPVKHPYIQPPYTLLIELTGILVHPDWTYKTGWRFKKRPGINYFFDKITQDYSFEIVIYTQELGFTAFPIIEALDNKKVVSYTLFRDSTKYVNGNHIKDLDRINRDLSRVIMIDCNPASVESHRSNAVVLPRWLGNDDDRSLIDLAAFLQTISSNEINDVRGVLEHYSKFDDPLAEFRDKQRILAEQEKEKESLMKTLGSKQQLPGISASWIPSFLRRAS